MRCRHCGKLIEEAGRKVYCSNLCANSYRNEKMRPITKIDKTGKKFYICRKCGKRLSKSKYRENNKLICLSCIKKREKDSNSQIFRNILIKNGFIKEITLEIPENSFWYYLNGKHVHKGNGYCLFRSAVKSAISNGYKLLCTDCFEKGINSFMVERNYKWICKKCNHMETANFTKVMSKHNYTFRGSFLCPDCFKIGKFNMLNVGKIRGKLFCKECNYMPGGGLE